MSPVLVRPARSSDAELVERIYVSSWNAGFADLLGPQEFSAERLARWPSTFTAAGGRWWVAVLDDRTVGFAGIGPSRDPVDPLLGELDSIAVDPSCWRLGVGRALMRTALEGLVELGYREAILWTIARYERGAAFYRSMGWHPDGGTRDDGRQVSFRWLSP